MRVNVWLQELSQPVVLVPKRRPEHAPMEPQMYVLLMIQHKLFHVVMRELHCLLAKYRNNLENGAMRVNVWLQERF